MKPTPTEQEILDQILREMRKAAATRDQLQITIDSFVNLGGAHVSFSFNPLCNAYEFTGRVRATRARKKTR